VPVLFELFSGGVCVAPDVEAAAGVVEEGGGVVEEDLDVADEMGGVELEDFVV